MEYRKLGRTGLKVSPLCMGTMQFGWSVGEADTHAILSATIDAGSILLTPLIFIPNGWMAMMAGFQRLILATG